MPQDMRPDKAHLFVTGSNENGLLEIYVDDSYPDAWKEGIGKQIVDALLEGNFHLLIKVGNQITFLCGKGREVPEKLVLDWTL